MTLDKTKHRHLPMLAHRVYMQLTISCDNGELSANAPAPFLITLFARPS